MMSVDRRPRAFSGSVEDLGIGADEHVSIVVLGASGDLAFKKTFPSLFTLYHDRFLASNTTIVGYARTNMSSEDFRNKIKKITSKHPESAEGFLSRLFYVHGGYGDAESFQALSIFLESREQGYRTGHRLFYYALPPSTYLEVSQAISAASKAPRGWTRVIVEKPFGHDLESSRSLLKGLSDCFEETQIFRIDHYLGKEMVLNMMVLRFANLAFSSFWNRNYISSVQISFKEDIGTEGRGGYFDQYGIIRDVMQNHLLQLLTIVAMETPASFDDSNIRDEKVKVLKQIAPLSLQDVVIGQFTASADGTKPGYRDDPTISNKETLTPTFATAVFHIRNERWDGVPFILRCGKALNERKAEIRIQMRAVPGNLFGETARNELVVRIQPKEAIYMKIVGKAPGLTMDLQQTELDLSYHDRYKEDKIPEAYERLILDVLRGDHSNFVRDDELLCSWRIFTPLLHQLEAEKVVPEFYPFGSRGPASSDALISKCGYIRYEGYQWSSNK